MVAECPGVPPTLRSAYCRGRQYADRERRVIKRRGIVGEGSRPHLSADRVNRFASTKQAVDWPPLTANMGLAWPDEGWRAPPGAHPPLPTSGVRPVPDGLHGAPMQLPCRSLSVDPAIS